MRLLRTTLAALALVAVATLSTAQPPTYTIPGVAGDATHSSAARYPVDASDPCSNTGRDRWINTVTGAGWYCKDHTIDDWAQVSPGGAGGGTGDVPGGANLSNNYDVFKTENPTTHVLEFRSLIAGTNLTMAENANDITINASGQSNTCSNEGAGQGQLCMPKVGVNLPILTLKQGTNVTLVTEGDNSVRIDGGWVCEPRAAWYHRDAGLQGSERLQSRVPPPDRWGRHLARRERERCHHRGHLQRSWRS